MCYLVLHLIFLIFAAAAPFRESFTYPLGAIHLTSGFQPAPSVPKNDARLHQNFAAAAAAFLEWFTSTINTHIHVQLNFE